MLVFVILGALYLGCSARLPEFPDGFDPFNWTSYSSGPTCNENTPVVVPSSIDPTLPEFQAGLQQFAALIDLAATKIAQELGPIAVSASVVFNQQLLGYFNAGTVQAGESTPPTENTVYDIGSITKIFTSLLLEKAIDVGVANYEDSVTDYYNAANPPEYLVGNPFSTGPATSLHGLATHTSGLPREPPGTIYGEYTEQQIFNNLAEISVMFPPLTTPHYSNLGAALLGRCLGRAFNTTYEDAMMELITDLGLNSTGFTFPPDIVERMATGYEYVSGKLVDAGAYNTFQFAWPAPCGGLRSTSADFAKFLMFLFSDGQGLLNQTRLAEFSLPGINFNDGISGFGWATTETFFAEGYTVVTKTGGVPGFATVVAWVPELRLGFNVFVNCGLDPVVDALAAQGMNILIPNFIAGFLASATLPPIPPLGLGLVGTYPITKQVAFEVFFSHETNLFTLTMSGQNYTGPYNPQLSSQTVTVISYGLEPSVASTYPCLTFVTLPSQGSLYVRLKAGQWQAMLPDFGLWEWFPQAK